MKYTSEEAIIKFSKYKEYVFLLTTIKFPK